MSGTDERVSESDRDGDIGTADGTAVQQMRFGLCTVAGKTCIRLRHNYPGLKSSNWYEISEKQFSRGYGAILTLRVGSKENAFALIDALKIPYTLSNIGDTKTLVIHPGSTISLHSSEQEKEDAGVFEDLIRVSVGIEDIEDLKADFAQAMETIAQR